MIVKQGRLTIHEIVTMQLPLDHLKVRLFQDFDSTPDEDLVLANLTECDFPGYTELIDQGWDAPVINGSDQAQGKSDLLTWTATTIITPQTIKAIGLITAHPSAVHRLFWIKKLAPTTTIGADGEVFQRYIDLFVDDIIALD